MPDEPITTESILKVVAILPPAPKQPMAAMCNGDMLDLLRNIFDPLPIDSITKCVFRGMKVYVNEHKDLKNKIAVGPLDALRMRYSPWWPDGDELPNVRAVEVVEVKGPDYEPFGVSPLGHELSLSQMGIPAECLGFSDVRQTSAESHKEHLAAWKRLIGG